MELIPMLGYPGQQEQHKCPECQGLFEIKEIIYEAPDGGKRVSLRCQSCDLVEVSDKGKRMLRYRLKVKR